jgi:hypothetical protein
MNILTSLWDSDYTSAKGKVLIYDILDFMAATTGTCELGLLVLWFEHWA